MFFFKFEIWGMKEIEILFYIIVSGILLKLSLFYGRIRMCYVCYFYIIFRLLMFRFDK